MCKQEHKCQWLDVKQLPQNRPNVAAEYKGAGEGIAYAANTQNGNGLADRINVDKTL